MHKTVQHVKDAMTARHGDLLMVMGTGSFSTTATTDTAAAGGLTTVVYGIAVPFHASAHGANDILGVDSDSLNTTTDVVTINRPASGTSGLGYFYILWGYKIETN